MFLSNMTYYDSCDCAVFKNCTSEVIPPPPTPVVPVPPPSGSTPCNYSCEDIQSLQATVLNLTLVINSQQDEIDMLISEYQDLAKRVTTLEGQSCCSLIQ